MRSLAPGLLLGCREIFQPLPSARCCRCYAMSRAAVHSERKMSMRCSQPGVWEAADYARGGFAGDLCTDGAPLAIPNFGARADGSQASAVRISDKEGIMGASCALVRSLVGPAERRALE